MDEIKPTVGSPEWVEQRNKVDDVKKSVGRKGPLMEIKTPVSVFTAAEGTVWHIMDAQGHIIAMAYSEAEADAIARDLNRARMVEEVASVLRDVVGLGRPDWTEARPRSRVICDAHPMGCECPRCAVWLRARNAIAAYDAERKNSKPACDICQDTGFEIPVYPETMNPAVEVGHCDRFASCTAAREGTSADAQSAVVDRMCDTGERT